LPTKITKEQIQRNTRKGIQPEPVQNTPNKDDRSSKGEGHTQRSQPQTTTYELNLLKDTPTPGEPISEESTKHHDRDGKASARQTVAKHPPEDQHRAAKHPPEQASTVPRRQSIRQTNGGKASTRHPQPKQQSIRPKIAPNTSAAASS
jgi:hypothetical protein